MKQKQWEQKHRLGSFRRRAKLPGSGPTDGPGGPGGSGGPGGAGGAGAIGDLATSQTLMPEDPRNMQLSPLPPTIGQPYARRQSYGDYSGQIRASLGRPELTTISPTLKDIQHNYLSTLVLSFQKVTYFLESSRNLRFNSP